MPHFHLYPSHPQILHSLVVELFVRVQACTVDHCSVLYTPACSSHTYTLWTVPHGPIYRYGGRLAGMWKSIVGATLSSAPQCLVVIAGATLPAQKSIIAPEALYVHTFFGTISLSCSHQIIHPEGEKNDSLFAHHAAPLEAQFPFIRAYKTHENTHFYLVNISEGTERSREYIDTILCHYSSDACIVFVSDTGLDDIAIFHDITVQ